LSVGADDFYFFVEWPENQILIPDWTYFCSWRHPKLERVVPGEGENSLAGTPQI